MASFRLRESMNCASVVTYCRTLKPARAVERQTAARAGRPTANRQLNRLDAAFLDSRAISVRDLRSQFLQNFLPGLPDVAGAQRQDQVPLARGAKQRVHSGIERAHVFHAAMPELTDALDERLRGNALDGLFRGRVDVH